MNAGPKYTKTQNNKKYTFHDVLKRTSFVVQLPLGFHLEHINMYTPCKDLQYKKNIEQFSNVRG